MLATLHHAFETDAVQDIVRFIGTVLLVAMLALLASHVGVADAGLGDFVSLVVEGDGGLLDWLIIY